LWHQVELDPLAGAFVRHNGQMKNNKHREMPCKGSGISRRAGWQDRNFKPRQRIDIQADIAAAHGGPAPKKRTRKSVRTK
jgi:hypothetical protein